MQPKMPVKNILLGGGIFNTLSSVAFFGFVAIAIISKNVECFCPYACWFCCTANVGHMIWGIIMNGGPKKNERKKECF